MSQTLNVIAWIATLINRGRSGVPTYMEYPSVPDRTGRYARKKCEPPYGSRTWTSQHSTLSCSSVYIYKFRYPGYLYHSFLVLLWELVHHTGDMRYRISRLRSTEIFFYNYCIVVLPLSITVK
jgi:hypothetical protein